MNYLSHDLQTLEVETFAVESLDGLGVSAAFASAAATASSDVTIATTSSTTSSSCG